MKGRGWLRDIPDIRDFSATHSDVDKAFHGLVKMSGRIFEPRSDKLDLRESDFFSEIDNQENLGSCTANAVVGVLEFCERKDHNGENIDHSRRFLYRVSRKLLYQKTGSVLIGDTGDEIRNTIKSLATFGAPPEWAWPYDVKNFDEEPPPDVYALANPYKALVYARLNGLEDIQATINNGYPAAMGFTCYKSIDDTGSSGDIAVPYIDKGDRPDGGHAVVAAGYDDNRPWTGGISGRGAVLIRNSWGTGFGEAGYGWLPYWWWLNGQADDFWVLNRASWVS